MGTEKATPTIEVAPAVIGDLPSIKQLADSNRAELGFVISSAVRASIESNELLIARLPRARDVVGFARYHQRRDGVTKIYEICVATELRRRGIATSLLNAIESCCAKLGSHELVLKCPEGASANEFYRARGFRKMGIESGKRRRLITWSRQLL